MSKIKVSESITGFLSSEITLLGELSCDESLSGQLSSATEYDAYKGNYNVTPHAFEAQTLQTAHKLMGEDVTIAAIPYWETSNVSNGMTAYIAKEV